MALGEIPSVPEKPGVPVAFYGVTLVKSQLYELTTVSSSALVVAVGMLLAAACVGSNSGAAGGVSGSGAGAKSALMPRATAILRMTSRVGWEVPAS